MDTVELRITGGLGNQLYQYAAARYIYSTHNANKIIIDIGEYESYKTRNFELGYILHNNAVLIKPIRSKKNSLYRMSYHIYQKLYRIIKKKRPHQWVLGNSHDKYLCAYIEYNPFAKLDTRILHMYGYFVSAKTAITVKEELMQELYLDNSSMSKECQMYLGMLNEQNTIGVSIRCAEDYVKNNWPICSKEYYRRGLEHILELKKNEANHIYVFADSIDKVRDEQWFEDYDNVIYIENLSVCESFELLRHCSNYVCSNSSFSWWGAFLSYSKDPIKVNPNKVFSGNSRQVDMETFYEGLVYLDYITGEIVDIT